MNEKINEKNTIYLVSIRLTEIVFITKAMNEKEAKIFVARHITNNKSIYKNLADIVNAHNFLDYITVIQLSTVTRIMENSTEGHVSNVARMLYDFDTTDNLEKFWDDVRRTAQ